MNSDTPKVRFDIIAGQKVKGDIDLSLGENPLTLDFSVFYHRLINPKDELKLIKAKVDAGSKLSLKDLTYLLILPMCGDSNFFDFGFFKECCSLGIKAFLSDGANSEKKIWRGL